jgi:hypothetical protein
VEGALALMKPQAAKNERGQTLVLFALLAAVLALLALGVFEYMGTSVRMMEAIAAADLAAHAGAQEVIVLPGGELRSAPGASQAAAYYYGLQARSYMRLASVWCGEIEAEPACEVSVQVRSPGILLPAEWITVRSVGYLAYGITRADQ